MPTTIQELERVHLRFISVKDDPKLTEILSKILPNILSVFLEPDLENTANLENEKIKAIEQILEHLIMRVKNSKVVSPPWVSLINIFNSPAYTTDFKNGIIKRHAFERIFQFIIESFDRMPEEVDQQFFHVLLQTMENDKIQYFDKCRLFFFLIQRLGTYVKNGHFEQLSQMLQPIMTEDLKKAFLQMCLYYIVYNIVPNSVQNSLRQTFEAAIVQMSQRFKGDIKETQTQFIANYENTILKVCGLSGIFTPEDQLPLNVMASFSSLTRTKETAELSVRNLFTSVNTKDPQLSEKFFGLFFTELYFYKDFSERQDQQVQPFNDLIQNKLLDYLMKFESSATQNPFNQKLVYYCLPGDFSKPVAIQALQFVKHMIRFNDLATDTTTVDFLSSQLLKIRNSPAYSEELQSIALHLLSEMAIKNYSALQEEDKLATAVFDSLKSKISRLLAEGIESIRNDPIVTNYIETLNRLRDCFEEHLKDQNKRNVIVQYVLNQLSTATNQEIIYVLFLYLIRLDSGQYNSAVLLHSIILKDHPDIKIKREAQRQLDNFNQKMSEAEISRESGSSSDSMKILRPFLSDIKIFLHKNHMNEIYEGSQENLKSFLTFNNAHFTQDFIEKMLEITQFALRFYKHDQAHKDQMMDLGDQLDVQDRVERLLMMNLNQNFQLIKSDFSQSLTLIFEYLKLSRQNFPDGPLENLGLHFIFKLSQGTVNLAQRVLALKILLKILKISAPANITDFLSNKLQLPQLEKIDTISHEAKMNTFTVLTILTLFKDEDQKMFGLLVNQLTSGTLVLGPNVMEQVKFMTACLRKIGQVRDLDKEPFMVGNLNQVVDYLITHIKRSEIDLNFRKYIILNLAGIVKKADITFKLAKVEDLLTSMIDIDNADIQEPLGKSLAKINFYAGQISEYSSGLLKKVMTQGVSLNTKRNSAIYLYQVIEIYGGSQKVVIDMFLDIQRVFLKFLFDRKAYMQDLSSKALSKIYHLGTPEVRTLLVEALSKTLAGEKSASEHQEKDENQELLLEFKDNTSTEQREKLKTYKDLCNIAVELGHRELIYQFLEVHRHLAHYQDIKNAAKGLSSIIMLDEKLRGDLLKIAPKILLLSYDHSNEVKETMKELWTNLIEVEKEEQIINSRWEEIYKEAFEGLTSKEYRRRQSSALALSDLMTQRTWPQIKDKYRELFLTTLGLMDDQKDSVKLAAFQLSKTMKRLTIKLGNIYTNGNVEELEEVLAIVIPMILDDAMKSAMQAVKFFAVDLLFDLVKTSQNQTMMNQLKFNNKYERQLVFNYNSEQKMKEIMNKFLDRIIVEVLGNLSQMNKAVETINYIEQLAIGQGLSTNSKTKNKSGISEGELNDLRLKYTKESAWGEILKICRDQLTQETFKKILPDIFRFMFKGHDQITKSASIAFIDDIILENKLFLITPQDSREIAKRLIDFYSLNSVGNALSMKESIQNLYASCLGLQMKILKAYPQTIQQLIDSLVTLPKELDVIICLNIYEISKNLPEDLLRSQPYLKHTYPIIYMNRFQTTDHRMKLLCRKAHTFLNEQVPNLVEGSQEEILKLILLWLDSNQYDDRVAAAQAMQELCLKLTEDDMRGSQIVGEVINKMHQLIQGKYFNHKEEVVEGFMSLIKIANLTKNADFVNSFIGNTCFKQIEKNLNQKLGYKNQILKSMLQMLEMTKIFTSPELKNPLFEILSRDLKGCLQKVSERASMIESMDEFEEKREEEKENMQTALLELECLPFLIPSEDKGEQLYISELCKHYYQGTNWLIRNGILKCYLNLLKFNLVNEYTLSFLDHLSQNVGDLGEKYDTNLVLISDIMLQFSEGPLKSISNGQERIKANISKIVQLLNEKGTEALIKNVDLIKRNIQ